MATRGNGDRTPRRADPKKPTERRPWQEPVSQQATIDAFSPHVAILDGRGEIIMTNAAWKRFSAANGQLRPSGPENYLEVCDRARDEPAARKVAAGLRAMLAGRITQFTADYPCHSPDQQRWFELHASRYEGPGDGRLLIAHTEVTERQLAEHQLQTHSTMLDEVDVAVMATDLDGRMTHWNRGAERLFGWTREQALGRDTAELELTLDTSPPTGAEGPLRVGRWEGQFKGHRRDGGEFPAYSRIRLIGAGPEESAFVAVCYDMSEQMASARALLEAHSHLKAVTNSMDEGLATLDSEGRLTYMNEAAERLLGFTRAELKGKVLHELTHHRRPDGTPLAVEDCPIREARCGGQTVRVDDDIFIRRDGSELAVSYTASPFATDEGLEGCALVFRDISEMKKRDQQLRRDAHKLTRIDAITSALAEDRLTLYSQPIVDVQSTRVVQRELLLRMREPDGTIEAPGTFLPVAEEYGLIGEIDRWVITQGIALAAAGTPVELNVSGCSVGDHLLLDHIRACLLRTGADPGQIVFELTETAFVTDQQAACTFADALHELGCKLALDDFGTGYGSFTYLKQLPVDYLKIDLEFIRDVAFNDASRHLVEAVVGIAGSFGLATVGEGVEDAECLEILARLGVDFAQGYHLGRPSPIGVSPTHAPAPEDPLPPAPARRQPGPSGERRHGPSSRTHG